MLNRIIGKTVLLAVTGMLVAGPAQAQKVVLTPAGTMLQAGVPASLTLSPGPADQFDKTVVTNIAPNPPKSDHIQRPLLPGEGWASPDLAITIGPRDLAAEAEFLARLGLRNNPDRVWTEQELRDAAQLFTTNAAAPAVATVPIGNAEKPVTGNQNLRVVANQDNDSPLSTSRIFPMLNP
jgi:hypothetical protein